MSTIIDNKREVARRLADAHRIFEPSIVRIVRIETPSEEDEAEPVKLLEVNPDTTELGEIMPVVFGAAEGVPFPSVVVEVTPGEFEKLQSRAIELPPGWSLGETLYPLFGEAPDASS